MSKPRLLLFIYFLFFNLIHLTQTKSTSNTPTTFNLNEFYEEEEVTSPSDPDTPETSPQKDLIWPTCDSCKNDKGACLDPFINNGDDDSNSEGEDSDGEGNNVRHRGHVMELTIQPRKVAYIDIKSTFNFDTDTTGNEKDDMNSSSTSENKNEKEIRGNINQIAYLVTSTQGDYLTVQIENGANISDPDYSNAFSSYILESRDSYVSCSERRHLKYYEQGDKLAIYCNNNIQKCHVRYILSILDVKKERDDVEVPACNQCSTKNEEGSSGNDCFVSVYLPVHSWYYFYFDEEGGRGMFLDFLISSHKKDTMRIEVQSSDGLFYLVATRRDKVRCSEPQKNVPVRWPSARIAVYCYNNYIGCRFSVFVRSIPMQENRTKIINSPRIKATDHSSIFNPSSTTYSTTTQWRKSGSESGAIWSDWSSWSECQEWHDGEGRQVRTRTCLEMENPEMNESSNRRRPFNGDEKKSSLLPRFNSIALVKPVNYTLIEQRQLNDERESLSSVMQCKGRYIDSRSCELYPKTSWKNTIVIIFIIISVILTIYVKRHPNPYIGEIMTSPIDQIIKTNIDYYGKDHQSPSNTPETKRKMKKINRYNNYGTQSEKEPLL